MAALKRILLDERSAIKLRHAAVASVLAAASVATGTFLNVAGIQVHERASERMLWALAEITRAIGA